MKKQKRAFSMLELQIAFVVLGIGLVGMGPLVITQIKQVRAIDDQMSEKVTYYFVPSTDSWVQKLGAAATMTSVAPGLNPPPAPVAIVNNLNVMSLEESPTGDELTATVSLTAIPQ